MGSLKEESRRFSCAKNGEASAVISLLSTRVILDWGTLNKNDIY